MWNIFQQSSQLLSPHPVWKIIVILTRSREQGNHWAYFCCLSSRIAAVSVWTTRKLSTIIMFSLFFVYPTVGTHKTCSINQLRQRKHACLPPGILVQSRFVILSSVSCAIQKIRAVESTFFYLVTIILHLKFLNCSHSFLTLQIFDLEYAGNSKCEPVGVRISDMD